MRHGLILPLFGGFAEVAAVADMAVAAEERGFDGVFVWDHVLSPVPGEWAIADPWVTLTAVAAATSRIAIGPMVTPIARRRIATLMRTTYSLAQFSGGRLIVGLGLGGDKGRELSAFGEPDDRAARVAKLTEGADILQRLWAGESVNHRSEAWVLEDVKIVGDDEPRPDIPIWMASTNGALGPARRAARYQGLYPIDVDLDGFKRIV